MERTAACGRGRRPWARVSRAHLSPRDSGWAFSFRSPAFADERLRDLVPVSHFWDQSDPRLFVCEAVREAPGAPLQPGDEKPPAEDGPDPTVP